ncbi:MAG: hypothetical protein QNK43_10340 [Amphritea sp.]|nr:hypothetical protein [Amphritea sp.]
MVNSIAGMDVAEINFDFIQHALIGTECQYYADISSIDDSKHDMKGSHAVLFSVLNLYVSVSINNSRGDKPWRLSN